MIPYSDLFETDYQSGIFCILADVIPLLQYASSPLALHIARHRNGYDIVTIVFIRIHDGIYTLLDESKITKYDMNSNSHA